MKTKQLLIASFLSITLPGSMHGMSRRIESPENMLFRGIEENDTNLINDALSKGANINARNNNEDTPLILAARNNQENVVKLLLAKNADPNIQCKNGNTVLILAAFRQYKNIVEFLLAANANSNIQNRGGHTALMHAVSIGNENIVNLLLSSTDLNLINNNGQTAMDIAGEKRGFEYYRKIEKILKDEQERRRLLIKTKIAESTPLFSDLSDIVSEYAVCPKKSKKP